MTKRLEKTLITLAVVAFWVSSLAYSRAEPPKIAAPPTVLIDDEPGVMMRSKLTRSKEVLEALLRNDFTSISRAAREMKRISEAAEWPRHRDAVYERFSAEFRRQCNQLESLAQDLNHEGVKFTYLNMTTTCINCHDYVRDSRRIAELRPARPEGDVRLRREPSPRPSRFR